MARPSATTHSQKACASSPPGKITAIAYFGAPMVRWANISSRNIVSSSKPMSITSVAVSR